MLPLRGCSGVESHVVVRIRAEDVLEGQVAEVLIAVAVKVEPLLCIAEDLARRGHQVYEDRVHANPDGSKRHPHHTDQVTALSSNTIQGAAKPAGVSPPSRLENGAEGTAEWCSTCGGRPNATDGSFPNGTTWFKQKPSEANGSGFGHGVTRCVAPGAVQVVDHIEDDQEEATRAGHEEQIGLRSHKSQP